MLPPSDLHLNKQRMHPGSGNGWSRERPPFRDTSPGMTAFRGPTPSALFGTPGGMASAPVRQFHTNGSRTPSFNTSTYQHYSWMDTPRYPHAHTGHMQDVMSPVSGVTQSVGGFGGYDVQSEANGRCSSVPPGPPRYDQSSRHSSFLNSPAPSHCAFDNQAAFQTSSTYSNNFNSIQNPRFHSPTNRPGSDMDMYFKDEVDGSYVGNNAGAFQRRPCDYSLPSDAHSNIGALSPVNPNSPMALTSRGFPIQSQSTNNFASHMQCSPNHDLNGPRSACVLPQNTDSEILPLQASEIKTEKQDGTNEERNFLHQLENDCLNSVSQNVGSANDTGKGTRHSDPYLSNPNTSMQAPKPCIEVIEQPRARGLRFRYKCEGRSAGTIPGEHSTNENRTYPTIRINNYSGPSAIVVVSCVTKDEPMPRPHPHALVGKDCKEGVCTVKLKGTNQISFPSLGIQCATKKEVQDALKQREKIRVDPWGRGYYENVNNIELGQVRLAFQAFLPDDSGKYNRIVPPVYSQLIYDKKSVSDLIICRLSRQSGGVDGGDEIFLLCEKVNKEDIQVRFFEENKHEGLVWEAYGQFGPQDVHRQVAIVFKTPQYRDTSIGVPKEVYIQLRRPSDDEVSDPKPFQYVPLDPDPDNVFKKRKRKNPDFKSFLSDIPFTPTGPPYGGNTKETLKQKLLSKNIAKRIKPPMVHGDYGSELSEEGAYMSVDQSATPFATPINTAGGVPSQWPQGINIPFSSHNVIAPMTSASHVNIPLSGQPVLKTEAKVSLSQGGPEFVQLGSDNKLLSLSNILPENIDVGMSLPSLPSIGEEFPNSMQMGMGVVAAEETVQSSDSPATAAPEAQAQQSPGAGAASVARPEQTLTLASLDRRIGESTDLLRSLQKN